jgi:hypothetical protein
VVFQLYGRELAALKSIDAYFVDTEHSRDETVRLYRGLVLVCSGRHNGDWTAFIVSSIAALEQQAVLMTTSTTATVCYGTRCQLEHCDAPGRLPGITLAHSASRHSRISVRRSSSRLARRCAAPRSQV